MTFKLSVCDVRHMLDDIPHDDQPVDEAIFWKTVAGELSVILREASHAKEPEIILAPVRKAGAQYIWEFEVKDLTLTPSSAINWHGQNISQWVYAGCILLSHGLVSTHH